MYCFYGCENAERIKPIEEFDFIDNLLSAYDILSSIWCEKTCAPRMRKNWTEDNKTLGQCSITAFLIQDIFGGKVFGIEREDGNYHCYNQIEGLDFDLTSEQFKDEKLIYDNTNQQKREIHFSKAEKKERYEYLKKMFFEKAEQEGGCHGENRS